MGKEIVDFIEEYRTVQPGADKFTIKPILDAYCRALGIRTVSESTFGRIIAHLKEHNRIPPYQSKTSFNGKTGKLSVREIKTSPRSNGLVPLNHKTRRPGSSGCNNRLYERHT